MAPMAEADCSGRRRFAVACSVLSRCVRADAAAGKVSPPCHARSEAQAAAVQPASTMLFMPGADVTRDETAAATAQLTVVYGGRALVFDDVPADKAAAVTRVAQQADVLDGPPADLQVAMARKALLQRLMEKRRDMLRERAPYAPARLGVVPPKRGGQEEGDAGRWLELGLPGGCAR